MAADLQCLVDYTPGAAAPTDATVLAAEQALAKLMPKLVRGGGPVADTLQRLFADRAAQLVPPRKAPIRDVDPLARTLVRFDTERALESEPERTVAHPSAANAFGGLVYVEVPKNQRGTMQVTLAGAVAAPRFVLGTTGVNAWREHIRALPGPWAELGTDKVVLTVPSAAIRELDDPTPLMQFWDRVLDGAADLAVRPHERGPRTRRRSATSGWCGFRARSAATSATSWSRGACRSGCRRTGR